MEGRGKRLGDGDRNPKEADYKERDGFGAGVYSTLKVMDPPGGVTFTPSRDLSRLRRGRLTLNGFVRDRGGSLTFEGLDPLLQREGVVKPSRPPVFTPRERPPVIDPVPTQRHLSLTRKRHSDHRNIPVTTQRGKTDPRGTRPCQRRESDPRGTRTDTKAGIEPSRNPSLTQRGQPDPDRPVRQRRQSDSGGTPVPTEGSLSLEGSVLRRVV